MTDTEYPPGTVATATVGGARVRVFRTAANPYFDWISDRSIAGDYGHRAADVTAVRPLVVLDPEDAEQVKRLAALLWPHYADNMRAHLRKAEVTADALREFANPTPPKPPEPTSIGAVVEDRIGNWWVNHYNGWHHCDGNTKTPQKYDAIDAVRVLSEGVAS